YVIEITVPLVRRAAVTSPAPGGVQTANRPELRQHRDTRSTRLGSTPRSYREPAQRRALAAVDDTVRLRPPRRAWLYMKVYGGRDLQADLIAGPLSAFAQDACSEGLIDDWFFIRYADPDPHVRFRLHGAPESLTSRVLPLLCEWGTWLMGEGPCTRF